MNVKHQSIYMVFSASAGCYLRVHEEELHKRLPNLTLEGADGNEKDNVVTYWYKPKDDE